MQRHNIRSILIAVVSLFCGAAGTVATFAPDGQVKATAATIANTCEANGVKAYPASEVPPGPSDAGTPAPLPQVPTAPASPAAELRHQGARAGLSRGVWLRALTPEAWPGESKGWA